MQLTTAKELSILVCHMDSSFSSLFPELEGAVDTEEAQYVQGYQRTVTGDGLVQTRCTSQHLEEVQSAKGQQRLGIVSREGPPLMALLTALLISRMRQKVVSPSRGARHALRAKGNCQQVSQCFVL